MAQALVNDFRTPIGGQNDLEEVVLVPSGKGRYEITVDGKLVYSKLQTGRHIADADAVRLIRASVSRS